MSDLLALKSVVTECTSQRLLGKIVRIDQTGYRARSHDFYHSGAFAWKALSNA
jgi:hypothetical protein